MSLNKFQDDINSNWLVSLIFVAKYFFLQMLFIFSHFLFLNMFYIFQLFSFFNLKGEVKQAVLDIIWNGQRKRFIFHILSDIVASTIVGAKINFKLNRGEHWIQLLLILLLLLLILQLLLLLVVVAVPIATQRKRLCLKLKIFN